jgi:hypothetical protein
LLYAELLEDSRRHAIDRMVDNAQLLGGNAFRPLREAFTKALTVARALQDRVDRPAAVLDRPGTRRAGNRRLGALVQHRPAALLHRLPPADGVRGPRP